MKNRDLTRETIAPLGTKEQAALYDRIKKCREDSTVCMSPPEDGPVLRATPGIVATETWGKGWQVEAVQNPHPPHDWIKGIDQARGQESQSASQRALHRGLFDAMAAVAGTREDVIFLSGRDADLGKNLAGLVVSSVMERDAAFNYRSVYRLLAAEDPDQPGRWLTTTAQVPKLDPQEKHYESPKATAERWVPPATLVTLATPEGEPPLAAGIRPASVSLGDVFDERLRTSLNGAAAGSVIMLSPTSNAVVVVEKVMRERAMDFQRVLPRDPHYAMVYALPTATSSAEMGSNCSLVLFNATAAVADLCREHASLEEIARMIERSREACERAGLPASVIPTRQEQFDLAWKVQSSPEYKAATAQMEAFLCSPDVVKGFQEAFQKGAPVADVSARSNDAGGILEGEEFTLPWREVRLPVALLPRPMPCRRWNYAEISGQPVDKLTEAATPIFLFSDKEVRLLDGEHRCALAHDQQAGHITVLAAFSEKLDLDETEGEDLQAAGAYLSATAPPEAEGAGLTP